MSQNFNFGREYQIPSGPHNSDSSSMLASAEFDIASQNAFSSLNVESKTGIEVEQHPLSTTLRMVHGLLDEARNDRIERHSTIRSTDNGGAIRGIARALFVKNLAETIRPRVIENSISKSELIEIESIEGGEIFGNSEGKNVKFFCDENGEWFYCEQIDTKDGRPQYTVFHYIAYDQVVLAIKDFPDKKMQHEHLDVDSQEAKNLTVAVEKYYERVMRNVYPESNIVNLDEHRKNVSVLTNKKAA